MGVVGQGSHAPSNVNLHGHGLAGGMEALKIGFGSDFIGQEIRGQAVKVIPEVG